MSRRKLAIIGLPASFVLVLAFQNCGGSSGGQLISGTDELASTQPTPSPVPTVTPALPRTLKVCASGCAYTLPSQAIAASLDNDTIEVGAGSYFDCFNVTKNNIKMIGTGGRARLTGKICSGKGEINISGTGTVIENFEFSGMTNADNNGAGIRHQGVGLVVRNSYFHDGQEGILSESLTPGIPTDTVLIENSKFENLSAGGNGQAHGVYLGHHFQVTVRNSTFLASQGGGHEFKCRAQNTLINCSHMAGLSGADSYSVNFPEGGNVEITNSVIEQGANSVNSGIVDFGSEMSVPFRYSNHQLKLSNVAVINDRSGGTFFLVRNSSVFTVSNSAIVGPGTLYSQNSATFTSVTQSTNRTNAGLTAYPSLPLPTGCTSIGLSN